MYIAAMKRREIGPRSRALSETEVTFNDVEKHVPRIKKTG